MDCWEKSIFFGYEENVGVTGEFVGRRIGGVEVKDWLGANGLRGGVVFVKKSDCEHDKDNREE